MHCKKESVGGLVSFILILVLAVWAGAALLSSYPVASNVVAAGLEPNVLDWELVQSNPGVFWYTLVFPTPNVGYALGGPDWNVNNGEGQVSLGKTIDGGQTWTVDPVAGTNRFKRGLACSDPETCWIAGASVPRILRTIDGGDAWTAAVVDADWTGWLWSAGWTGVDTTVLVGTSGYADQPGRRANFLRSTDGTIFSAEIANDPREIDVYDFSCPTPGVCYAAAQETAFYSADNGNTWIRKGAPAARFYGVWCTDNDTCWLVGGSEDDTTDGVIHIYRSRDGGDTWEPANAPPQTGHRPRLFNVQMVDASHGYAVGCIDAPDELTEECQGSGLLMRTVDGFSWHRVTSPTDADIMDLWVHNMDEVILLDHVGRIWRGTGLPTPTPSATPTTTASPTYTPTPTATPPHGTVTGKAYFDQNSNLFPDEDEPGLAGAVFALKRGNTVVATHTSNSSGQFAFVGIEPGFYTLVELSAPASYAPSPNLMTFEVTADSTWTTAFAHSLLVPPTPTSTPTTTPTGSGCYCSFLPAMQRDSSQRAP
jgi:photosystem II stability/assembly factor-like uncharacterized protein